MNFSPRKISYLLALVLALGALCYSVGYFDESSLSFASTDVRVLDSDLDDNLDMLKPAIGVYVHFAFGDSTPVNLIRSDFVSLSILPESRGPPFNS